MGLHVENADKRMRSVFNICGFWLVPIILATINLLEFNAYVYFDSFYKNVILLITENTWFSAMSSSDIFICYQIPTENTKMSHSYKVIFKSLLTYLDVFKSFHLWHSGGLSYAIFQGNNDSLGKVSHVIVPR